MAMVSWLPRSDTRSKRFPGSDSLLLSPTSSRLARRRVTAALPLKRPSDRSALRLLVSDKRSHGGAVGTNTRASGKAGVVHPSLGVASIATSAPGDGRWRPGVGEPPARRAENEVRQRHHRHARRRRNGGLR
jgi:hypothetical protein